jgi:hypothetical protein
MLLEEERERERTLKEWEMKERELRKERER